MGEPLMAGEFTNSVNSDKGMIYDESMLEFSSFPAPEGTTDAERKVMRDYLGIHKPESVKKLCEMFPSKISLVRGLLEILRHDAYNRVQLHGTTTVISQEPPTGAGVVK